jgi:hypothetical protein
VAPFRYLVLLFAGICAAQTSSSSSDPAGALGKYAIARFSGSGSDSIQAMTSDASGNVYVAGTTTSLDLPVKNAAQPRMGGAQ